MHRLLGAIPLFLAEVRKNDQSRSSTDTEAADAGVTEPLAGPKAAIYNLTVDGDLIGVIDTVPLEPSLLPVTSVADRYTRSMLKCLAGYALYDPQPFSELSTEYPRNGINVGDVGFVNGDGAFDFLFNVCPSINNPINPSKLPDHFFLGTSECAVTRATRPFPPESRLFQSPVTRTKSGECICEGSEGAILELPEGAIQEAAMNIRSFEKLAARHGVEWYEYTISQGRKISNGSLYLITSFTKCAQWGIGVFDRPCAPGQGLTFDRKRTLLFGKPTTKYHWRSSQKYSTKVSNSNQVDVPNQCVLLRGYKIMIRQDIFDDICNDLLCKSNPTISSSASITITKQKATNIRDGGRTNITSKGLNNGLLSWASMSTMARKSDKVVSQADFNSSPVHPSDLINDALLKQNKGSKAALTHDDVWCNLLRDNFPKLNDAALLNIARSYTSTVDEYDCVSLNRISDAAYIFGASDCQPQGAEILSLQRSLSAPGDNGTRVDATISLPLPHELVERILLLLDAESMLSCRVVNRELNEIIQSSTPLQYFLVCKAAGVIDNPRSPLSYAERLEVLKGREEAWRTLKPVFEKTIKVNQSSSNPIFTVTGGAFIITDDNRRDLHFCRLPSSIQDDPQWTTISGHGPGEGWPGFLVTFAIAIYEYDLIISVISSEIENQADMQRHTLDLIPLKFSTGEYHPLASLVPIHVQVSPSPRPRGIARVVGDNLALIVHNEVGTLLFIFNWKTGYKRLEHEVVWNAYSDLAFLSPELLLVPNHILCHFEVWYLPPLDSDPKSPFQILSLQLPAISPGHSIISLAFNGEPNPFHHSIPHSPPPRPFLPFPENSIIIAKLYFSSLASHNLIIHRRALLNVIQNWTLPSLERQDPPKNAVPDDGSERFGEQSISISMLPDPGPSTRTSVSLSCPTSENLPIIQWMSSGSGSPSIFSGLFTPASKSQYIVPRVQWKDWGPPISRWNQSHAVWTKTSSGQRCVLVDPNPGSTRVTVNIADFNPYRFRMNVKTTPRPREEGGDNGDNKIYKGGKDSEEATDGEDTEALDHEGMFQEEVHMGLKCAVYRAPDEYDFDEVLMDDERLLGLKLNFEDGIESVTVLYIG